MRPPLIVGLQPQHADQGDDDLVVGEDADDVGVPLHLVVARSSGLVETLGPGTGRAASSTGVMALAAARARGVRLGNPNGAAALKWAEKGGAALREMVASNADAHAVAPAPVIAALQQEGHTSLRALANELNAIGMRTRRGGKWHVSTVRNLLERQEVMEDSAATTNNAA